MFVLMRKQGIGLWYVKGWNGVIDFDVDVVDPSTAIHETASNANMNELIFDVKDPSLAITVSASNSTMDDTVFGVETPSLAITASASNSTMDDFIFSGLTT